MWCVVVLVHGLQSQSVIPGQAASCLLIPTKLALKTNVGRFFDFVKNLLFWVALVLEIKEPQVPTF
jgi:hypothetical protein